MATIGRQKIIDIGKTIIPEFEISNENISNYENLFYYFTNNLAMCQERGIDLSKGLWIYGDRGSGKSIAMKVFQEFCAYTPHLGNRRFSIYRYKKIEDDYKKYHSEIFELYGVGALRDLCFDEFLKSSGVVNDYGVKKNLAELILDDRYESFVYNSFKTHIVTNIPPSYLEENKVLDDRILDRATSMFNIIEWKGGSRRK